MNLGLDCSSPKLSEVPFTHIPFLANLNQFSMPLVQMTLDRSIAVPFSIELALEIYKPEFLILLFLLSHHQSLIGKII